ncbi:MAG: biotin/lipoyl-containing protein [Hyphomicrobiales bacterium]
MNQVRQGETPGGQDSGLAYCDVFRILALLDHWPEGTLEYEDQDLKVSAILGKSPGAPTALPEIEVASPAVGIVRLSGADAQPGSHLHEQSVIAHIETLDRSTPVNAGREGRLLRLSVGDGDFVEFGQPLAAISQTPAARSK